MVMFGGGCENVVEVYGSRSALHCVAFARGYWDCRSGGNLRCGGTSMLRVYFSSCRLDGTQFHL